MSKELAANDELAESVVDTLRRVGISPLAHFAHVAIGKAKCLLCDGDGTVNELTFTMHCSKAVSFDMARALSESDDKGPCPECYGRGYVYSGPERADRAAKVLLDEMPEAAPSTGPIVRRFHKAHTIEEAYQLDKEMTEGEEDQGDVLDGEFVISTDEMESYIDQVEAEQAEEDEEVFWTRPVDEDDNTL